MTIGGDLRQVPAGIRQYQDMKCLGHEHRERKVYLVAVWAASSLGTSEIYSCRLAAPAQYRSQVISRSKNPQARSPGVRGVARIFSWVHFFLKKVDDLF